LNLSNPAHAIIAPLSVHRFIGGTYIVNPFSVKSLFNSVLIYPFAATPPAIAKLLLSEIWAKDFMALEVRSFSISATVY
jgi:hypothetical protein